MIPTALSVVSRRALLVSLAAWQAQDHSQAARAAIRGAEDAYATQRFEQSAVCTRRTPLGACATTGQESVPVESARPVVQRDTPVVVAAPAKEPESELIRALLAKTEANAEKNAREVQEKTIKNGLGGQFGPFAKEAPVMKADGSFDIIPLYKYDKFKDQKKIVLSKNGLDMWAPGWDLEKASIEQPKKFLGLF